MRAFRTAVAWLTVSFCSTAVWAAEGCTVNAVQGAPTVVREGKTLDVHPKDSLKSGDMVSAGPECRVDLSMNDLAGCRILAGSKLKVVAWKKENMSVRIVDGNIVLNLKKLPDDAAFKVETPSAIASVRGTQFWGRVQPGTHAGTPPTTFAVREGTVEVWGKNTKKSFILKPGEALDVGGTPRKALPEEMAAMEQAAAIPNEAKS